MSNKWSHVFFALKPDSAKVVIILKEFKVGSQLMLQHNICLSNKTQILIMQELQMNSMCPTLLARNPGSILNFIFNVQFI